MRWREMRQEDGDLILVFAVEGERVEKRANRIYVDQELFKIVRRS